MGWSRGVVDGSNPFTGDGSGVKRTQRRAIRSRRGRRRHYRRTRRCRDQPGTVVEDGIVIEIVSGCDVERSARVYDHERAQAEVERKSERAAKEEPVPNV